MIEAITICVEYDDFLSETIPYNMPLFDRWIIVTSPRDKATRNLCKKYGLECLLTGDGQVMNEFRKGRMIERGLQHLTANGWRVHIDADMALPRHFRNAINSAELSENAIYGVDRLMCKSWQLWQRVKSSGYLDGGQHANSHMIHFPDWLPMGARWSSHATGYVPIGAFQLWHSSEDLWSGIRTKPYPQFHNNACRTDIQQGLKWDRPNRQLLPEVVAVHLESEPCKTGTNWSGRKTKRFGPNRQENPTPSVS